MMTDIRFFRGEVWAAVLPGMTEDNYYLVVSSNSRNRALRTCLVVRITSTDKPDIPSIVRIPNGECVTGRVLCDDVEDMWPEDARTKLGAFTPSTMQMVNAAIAVALGLT